MCLFSVRVCLFFLATWLSLCNLGRFEFELQPPEGLQRCQPQNNDQGHTYRKNTLDLQTNHAGGVFRRTLTVEQMGPLHP